MIPLAPIVAALSVSRPARAAARPPARQTLYYIPHTHWEGAVFKTREEYLQMGLPNILKALDLLKKHPDYRFTLDQVAYVKPFLERYPEEAAAFRKFVKEGRLEIVGGMDVMPDDVKPGGELFVRQMQYGKRWCREALGVDVKVAWLLDTFGHHPQLPQLLKQAGYTSFWFCRGVPNNKMPSEFLWRGIDGTTIPAFWLPGFYGLLYGPPRDQAGFDRFFAERFHSLDSHAAGAERVGLAGVDVSEPEDYVMPLVEQFNQRADAPFAIRPSVPSEFSALVAKRSNVPVLDGDFSPIFQGTYSSRIELKQATREVERKLVDAEKLGAIAGLLGAPSDGSELWRAWEPILFNQTHDLASGVMTDHVYEDVQRGYAFAGKFADDWNEARCNSIVQQIDTRGEGIPIALFNTLGFSRTEYVEVDLGFANQPARSVVIKHPNGQTVESQIVEAETYANGDLKHARVGFLAKGVPALGYAVFRALPSPDAPSRVTHASGDALESEHFRVTVDRGTGAITSVRENLHGTEMLSGPANVVSREVDHGDLWELYRGLDGASYIAMTDRQPVPAADHALLSIGQTAKDGTIRSGPVFSELHVSHPLGNGEFATRVRVYHELGRVDIETELVNREKYVRYQALFPTAIKGGKYVQEIPFGAAVRPDGVENAAQNWADYSTGQQGVALLNAGMPGNVMTDGTLMLSLLRSHNLGAYGFGGGYEPGMSSESGFEVDQQRTFNYAIVPHAGDWRQAAVYRDGLSFNTPLIVRKAEVHGGPMPAQWGLLEISQPNVMVSSVKQLRDGVIAVRLYEASGTATPDVTLSSHLPLVSANESDLMETPRARLAVTGDAVHFGLHPFEIKTLLLRIRPAAKTVTRGRNAVGRRRTPD